MNRKPFLIGIVLLCLQLTGCGPSDNRLADYAQWSVDRQTQQNLQQAEQNEDLLTAQRSLHQGIHQERAHLDQQHDDLEAQRREIADQRIHEPLVAEAIQSTGLLLACLLPLLICAYALRQAGRMSTDEELGPVLLRELEVGTAKLADPSLPASPVGTGRLLD